MIESKVDSKLHVLCMLGFLPSPGSGNRKEGVYPTFIRAHSDLGIKTGLAVLRTDDYKKTSGTASELGSNLVIPEKRLRPHLVGRYAKIILKSSAKIHSLYFGFRYLNLLSGIEKYIQTNGRPDLIAALTSISNPGRLAYLVSKFYGIPFVTRENRTYYTKGMMKGYRARFTQEIAKNASAILTVSPQLAQKIEETLCITPEKIVVFQNAVAESSFVKPDDTGWVSQFAKDRFIFAGWTDWRTIKRPDLAIEAFAMLKRKHPETCLILAGPISVPVDEIIKKHGIEESVLLTGPLDREGVRQLAHGCHCCIVPSDHDPGNNSILEAMAAGKPCIVTRCGGSESRITDPSLGRVVDKGNARSFADAMIDVQDNYNEFNPGYIISTCRLLYSEEALKDNLASIYSNVLSRLKDEKQKTANN